MKKTNTYLLLFFFIFGIFSCKSEDDKILPNPLEEIQDSKWAFTKVFSAEPVKIGSEEIQDFLADLSSCEVDDLLFFRGDNVLLKDEGSEKCNESNKQESICGTWQLDGLTIRTLIDENEVNNLIIECLNETEMSGILEGTFDTGPELIPFTAEFYTYKKVKNEQGIAVYTDKKLAHQLC